MYRSESPFPAILAHLKNLEFFFCLTCLNLLSPRLLLVRMIPEALSCRRAFHKKIGMTLYLLRTEKNEWIIGQDLRFFSEKFFFFFFNKVVDADFAGGVVKIQWKEFAVMCLTVIRHKIVQYLV